MKFEARPNPRCQRGMRVDYLFEGAVTDARLCELLKPLFEGKMVRACEQWGAREVVRMVLQFRFELRVGERDGQLSVLYRRCCPSEARSELKRRLGEILSAID